MNFALLAGGGTKCAIIAEIGNAHNGDFGRAIRLLDAAKEAGATAAKLQCYSVAELIALRGNGPAPAQWGDQGWSMRDLYAKAMTPREWFPSLYKHAEVIGLPVYSSVFGLESITLLESLGNTCYKISKMERLCGYLITAARHTGKPVIVSVPSFDDIPSVALGCMWLYCPGSYPSTAADFRLPLFEENYLGVSSHCLDPRLPTLAVARGAKMLEYHFQLDDEPSELEANISLTASQFKAMVADVRATEALCAF